MRYCLLLLLPVLAVGARQRRDVQPLVSPHDAARVMVVKYAGDHGDESPMVSGGSVTNVPALAVAPADSKTLYGAFGSQLRVSADWGAGARDMM